MGGWGSGFGGPQVLIWPADHTTTMPPLNEMQQKIYYIAGTLTAILSIIGSSIIVLSVERKNPAHRSAGASRTTTTTIGTYERILQRMSMFDIVHSSALVFMPYLTPSATGVWSTYGTPATCSLCGFLAQSMGQTVYCYSNALNTFYILVVVAGWKTETITRRIEPWMHGISVGFPFVTAVVGLILHVYAPSQLGYSCWIDVEQHVMLGAIFALPFFVCVAWLPISNLLIYCAVSRVLGRTTRTRDGTSSVSYNATVARRNRDVAVQATLYVLAVLIVVPGNLIIKTKEKNGVTSESASEVFAALLWTQICYPLLGFCNCIIFLRPQYVKFRRRYPLESRWWCLKNAVWSRSIQDVATAPTVATTTVLTHPNCTLHHGSTANAAVQRTGSSLSKEKHSAGRDERELFASANMTVDPTSDDDSSTARV